MVTSAVARLVMSALLIAITCDCPAVAGAVYKPAWVIVPGPSTAQVTEVSDAPATAAAKGCVAPATSVTVGGLIETAMLEPLAPPPPPPEGAVGFGGPQ